MAGRKKKSDDGEDLHESHQRESEVRPGPVVDFPAHRHGLHVDADRVRQIAEEKPAKIADSQRAVRIVTAR